MNVWHLLGALLTAYLLGSIPTAVWYGEAYFGMDIRKFGSGNAGANNTFRVLGKRAGVIVLLIDVLKGWTASMLAVILYNLGVIESENLLIVKLLLGFVAVLGHLYPIFIKFKGGKGVATSLGMVLAIHPDVAAICIGIFVLVLVLSKIVSLSSMLATLAFPIILAVGVFGKASPLMIGFGCVLALTVIIKHHQNIARIIKGTEGRVYLFGKGRKKY